MYKITANGKSQLDIQYNNGTYEVNGQTVQFDLHQTAPDTFHLLLNNKSFEAILLGLDDNKKTASLKVNGQLFNLEMSDDFDLLLVKLGIDKKAGNKVSKLVAPMPGLVLSVSVKIGDAVRLGDNLLVLEAMKMENVLPSPTEGVIAEIAVAAGDKVDKNQVLIRFE